MNAKNHSGNLPPQTTKIKTVKQKEKKQAIVNS